MTKIKICGIQNTETALTAAQAGTDLIGLVFVPGRRRCITTEKALEIISTVKQEVAHIPKIVGIFADQPISDVNRITEECYLDMAQLCGQEPLEYCSEITVSVIKVLHIKKDTEKQMKSLKNHIENLQKERYLIILDRYVKGVHGGSGRPFDWEIARHLSNEGWGFLLAGGLTPYNVVRAVNLVQPWGVDVSSGVEIDGMKDKDKIKLFINRVRNASPL